MLSDGDAVEAVWSEIADAVDEGAIWWQCSTVGIEATERLLAAATIP